MIDLKVLERLKKELVLNNNPFPHLISNNFLPQDIVKQAEKEFIAFNELKDAGGYRYENLKYHFNDFSKMPKTIKTLISFFHSEEFILFLEKKYLY